MGFAWMGPLLNGTVCFRIATLDGLLELMDPGLGQSFGVLHWCEESSADWKLGWVVYLDARG